MHYDAIAPGWRCVSWRPWPAWGTRIKEMPGTNRKFLFYSAANRAARQGLMQASGFRCRGRIASQRVNGTSAERLTAMASSESERSRLRLMPCSTCTRARAAPSIQSTVRPSARRARSAARSSVADQSGGSGHDQEQILDEAAEGAEQADGFFLAIGAGAVALSDVEESGVVDSTPRTKTCPWGPPIHARQCAG